MKYIKLYWIYAKRSLMAKLIYKANMFIGIFAFLFTQISSLVTLYLLISVVPSLDGYSKYEIGMLFALTNMAIGLDHLFTDRLWNVAYWEVRGGKMDHLFLRPLPLLFQVIASEVQLEALGEIIVAIALFFVCGNKIALNINFGNIFLIIIGIICASIIISSFKIFITSFAFIFKKSGPLLQFVYNFATYSKYPLKIYPKAIQFILTFIIPLGVCLFLPFDNLFSLNFNPYILSLYIIIISLIFAIIAVLFWNKCAKRYESTGT